MALSYPAYRTGYCDLWAPVARANTRNFCGNWSPDPHLSMLQSHSPGLWTKPLGMLGITHGCRALRGYDCVLGCGLLATRRGTVEGPPLWAFCGLAESVKIPLATTHCGLFRAAWGGLEPRGTSHRTTTRLTWIAEIRAEPYCERRQGILGITRNTATRSDTICYATAEARAGATATAFG